MQTDNLIVRTVDTLGDNEVGEVVRKLDEWLGEFTDPQNEIEEAVRNALEKGYVVFAIYRGELAGIAIVTRVNFETFFPKYHLAYIATKPSLRGRGIGSTLLRKVAELTDGEFSLHVDINNEGAIRLYRRMGLKIKYYRMLYRGRESLE